MKMPRTHPCVSISVLVAQKDGKFCSTDEKKGWYLPAGRVDFGESFTTAAVRESMEEAGLDAVIDGLLRFEYSIGGLIRLRAVFAAHQKDENMSLKEEADDETYGAEWLTIEELKAIGDSDPDMIAKLRKIPRIVAINKQRDLTNKRGPRTEKLRAKEPIRIFEWVRNGTKVFSSRLYQGFDGKEINNFKVKVNTNFNIVLVAKDIKKKNYYITSKEMIKAAPFHQIASKLLVSTISGKSKKLTGICGIYHVAPVTASDTAEVTISFYYESTKVKVRKNAVEDVIATTGKEVVENAEKFDKAVVMAVENCEEGIIAPLEFLAPEGSKYVVLQ